MQRGGRHNRNNAPRAPVADEFQTLVVRGWQQSKAASNPDGGVESLLIFLEKKASPRNGPLYKSWDPEVVGDSLEIAVKEGSVDSYLHLNGFTWAGTTISVERKRASHRNAFSNVTNRSSSVPNSLENRVSAPSGPRQNNPASRALPQNNGARHPRGQMSIDGRPHQANTADICDLSTKAPIFRDQGGVAQNFISAIFPLYDSNREEAIRNFYDDKSVFSLSAVTRQRRKDGLRSDTNLKEYIRLSRNLKRVTTPSARATRKSKGQKDIFDIWNTLPKTQHPPLADSASWLFECHPVHNLPHLTDSTAVSGLSISIHGCFQDMDKENRVDTKSFDRSFILGPGGGVGGIRVISDALVVRDFYPTNTVLQKANLAPSGATAATVQPPQPQLQLAPPAPAPSPIPPHPEIPAGSDFGQASPGKTDEQLLKEKMKLELSFATRMKLAYAEDALANSNWDYPVALGKFNEMNGQGNIPMDVFLNV
jgi:hypothetical protein